MIARENAHYFEKALISALSERNEGNALLMINAIKNQHGYPSASLNYVDDNGRNFLSFALEVKLPNIARTLLDFDILTNDPKILFSVHPSKQQTLICQAAENNYTDIVEKLLECSTNYLDKLPVFIAELHQGYQCWHKADGLGNTPLFYAIKHQNIKLMIHFINLMAKDEVNHAALANHSDHAGNTALHRIFNQGAGFEALDQLLSCGASMTAINQKRETPFKLFRLLDADTQINILATISKSNISKLASIYKEYLKRHPDDSEVRRVYYTLAGARLSLKELLIANLETNPEINPQKYYHQTSREEGFVLVLTYRNIPTDEHIRHDVLLRRNILYLYLDNATIKIAGRDENNRIQRISIDNELRAENYFPIKETLQDVRRSKSLTKNDMEVLASTVLYYGYTLLIPPYKKHLLKKSISDIEDIELVRALPTYLGRLSKQGFFGFASQADMARLEREQLFLQDKNTLSDLISEVELCLKRLASYQPRAVGKIISIVLPLMSWLFYSGVEAWMIVETAHESNRYYGYDFDKQPPVYKQLPVYHDLHHQGGFCYREGNGVYYAYNGDTQYSYCWQKGFYNSMSLVVGLFGAGGNILLSYKTFQKCWNRPPSDMISKNEWQRYLQALQAEVMSKLDGLADEDSPFNPDTVKQLTEVITQLDNSQPKQQAIAKLTRMAELLKIMQSDLDKSHQPFSISLFKHAPRQIQSADREEVVVDILEPSQSYMAESDSNEEEIPFLDAPVHIRSSLG